MLIYLILGFGMKKKNTILKLRSIKYYFLSVLVKKYTKSNRSQLNFIENCVFEVDKSRILYTSDVWLVTSKH